MPTNRLPSAFLLAASTLLLCAACSTPSSSDPALAFLGPTHASADAALGSPTADAGAEDTLWTADAAPGGADAADAGPDLSVAAPDATVLTDLGAAADVAIAQDVVKPVDAAAPADVAAAKDVAAAIDAAPAVDVGPAAAVCGDGLCQPPAETASTCPADCSSAFKTCLGKKCKTQASSCTAVGACSGVLDCAAACSDLSCLQGCAVQVDYATLSTLVEPLATCAVQAGCVSGAKAGPGGGPASCNNAKCDNGETHLTCPADCPFPISASEQCQVQKCAASYAACASDAACVAAATCWNDGGSMMNCAKSNATALKLGAVIQCIQTSCANVATQSSCQGKCGSFVQGAACNCDTQCKKYNDCCPDYASVCGG